MKSITPMQVGLLIVLAAVVGGVYYFAQKQQPQEQIASQQNQEQSGDIFTLAGQVKSVENNSFVMAAGNTEYTVNIGPDTQMIQLSLPSGAGSSEETSFIPDKNVITVSDIKARDQVFIRSSHVIKTGENIINPLEVQVLP